MSRIPYKGWSEEAKERRRAYMRTYWANNPDKRKKNYETWLSKNVDGLKAIYQRHRRRRRDYLLQYMYGISKKQYDAMWVAQSGLCAICDGPGNPGSKWKPGDHMVPGLRVDHDHLTGQVRGLLCQGCNVAIGILQDDPEILRRATLYLQGLSYKDVAA